MVVNVAGSSMDSNDEQPSKKLDGRLFCVTGRLIDFKLEQYANAYVPSEVTEAGITIVSSKLMFLHK